MVQVKHLGVRPYPEENESYAGYLLRIAKLNGFQGLKDFFGTIGIKPTMVKSVGRWSSDQLQDCFTRLSPYMARSPEILFSRFAQYSSIPWIYREKRMIQDLRLNHPRICPECIAEGRTFDWRWGLAHVSHCPNHYCQLIESCPSCEKPLDWKRELITGCSCGYIHQVKESEKHFAVSALEQKAWNSDLSHDELDSICQMIVKLSRPYDSFHQTSHGVPQEHGYSGLVKRSYQMIENTERQSQWIGSIESVRDGIRALGNRAVQLPIEGLDIIQPDHITSSPGPLMPEHKLFIKPSRSKSLSIKINEDLRFQVRSSDLASVMGIPSSEVQYLIDSKAIKPVNRTNIHRDQLFDLRALLSYRMSPSNDSDCLVIRPNSKELTKHLTSYGRLLAEVINHNIEDAFYQGYNFAEIRISQAGLSDWLSEELRSACQEPVPSYKAKAVLGCNDQALRELVTEGELHWIRYGTSFNYIDGRSFYRFLLS